MLGPLHPSTLPRAFLCPASLLSPQMALIEDSEPARTGNAVHEILPAAVRGEDIADEYVANVAGYWQVSAKDMFPMIAVARKAIKELGIPSTASTEVAVDVGDITGTIDVEWESGPNGVVLHIVDWKSGYKDSSYYHQLAGYACAAIRTKHVRVIGTVVWLRTGEVETYEWTLDELQEWRDRLAKVQASAIAGNSVTGDHCVYCKRSHECAILKARVSADIAVIADEATAAQIKTGLRDLAPSKVAEMRRALKRIESFAGRFETAFKALVHEVGTLDPGDGTVFQEVEEPGRREIDTLKAWPVLSAKLTDEEIAAVVTVGATALDDTIAKKAGKGKGAAAKRELAEELKQAGALSQPPVLKIKELRKENAR